MLKARIDILLEEYESLKEENQRLNNDIKVLLKENEEKEKVIIKQNNVLNELEKIKFYIEQNGIKDMLWGKEILKIIGDD